MRVLLRIIRRQGIGDITTKESSHSAPVIRIGRGTDCDIHLPDAGIQLEHATLELSGGLRIYSSRWSCEYFGK